MKFQEELISKLMTYFTVILLLGILIFEAWSLQRERGFRKEAEDTATTALDNVDNLSSLNDRLEQEILAAGKPNQDNYTAIVLKYHGKGEEQ